VRKLGVLGAGMMGSGHRGYVSAAAGVDVLLLDTELPLAQKGKGVLGHVAWRSRFSEASEPRCRPTGFWRTSIPMLTTPPGGGCEPRQSKPLFEDARIKADVTRIERGCDFFRAHHLPSNTCHAADH